jgi:hypothetical protein
MSKGSELTLIKNKSFALSLVREAHIRILVLTI